MRDYLRKIRHGRKGQTVDDLFARPSASGKEHEMSSKYALYYETCTLWDASPTLIEVCDVYACTEADGPFAIEREGLTDADLSKLTWTEISSLCVAANELPLDARRDAMRRALDEIGPCADEADEARIATRLSLP